MLNVVFIFLIFFEIVAVSFAVNKIIEADKKIKEIDKKVISLIPVVEEIHTKIRSTVHKINFVVSILSNKRIFQIKKIISTALELFEIYMLIKSLNFSKGIKFNFKNLKKLLLTRTVREVAIKVFNSFAAYC